MMQEPNAQEVLLQGFWVLCEPAPGCLPGIHPCIHPAPATLISLLHLQQVTLQPGRFFPEVILRLTSSLHRSGLCLQMPFSKRLFLVNKNFLFIFLPCFKVGRVFTALEHKSIVIKDLSSNPESTTSWLCNFKQVTYPPFALFFSFIGAPLTPSKFPMLVPSEWLHTKTPTVFSQKASSGPVSMFILCWGQVRSAKQLKLHEVGSTL